MVKQNTSVLDDVFRALADPTRRGMLRELGQRERSVSELAAPYRMSLAAASKHLKVLENAGLVKRRIAGRTHYCALAPGPLVAAHEWLAFYAQFWDHRLDGLEALLKTPE